MSGRLVQRPVRNSPTQACGVDGVLRPRAPLSVVPTCIVSACFILEGLLRVGRWPGTNATATNDHAFSSVVCVSVWRRMRSVSPRHILSW